MDMNNSISSGITNEEWRSMSGFINYQISNLGRIRNVNTGRILKLYLSNIGYYAVSLYSNSKRSIRLIHRVVAQEFIDNPDNKQCVDHINHWSQMGYKKREQQERKKREEEEITKRENKKREQKERTKRENNKI